MKKVNFDELAPYAEADYQLLPLHQYSAKSTIKGKEREDGKRPRDAKWTKRLYDNNEVLTEAAESNRNIGIRLKASQLVVDVDPRNMPEGEDTFKALCEAVGLDPTDYPVVITGSGGLHVYMTKPDDVPVLDSVKGYEGVEFKTVGRQVVAAGSIHPKTGKHYEWDFDGPELKDAPAAPERLLAMIKRPTQVAGAGAAEAGVFDQELIADMLEKLDPGDYDNNEDWLRLMMAVHHASNGNAREEFLDWCARDPRYADERTANGLRWDSLHREQEGDAHVVTWRTLRKELMDHDAEAVIPTEYRRAAEDFPDDTVVLPEEDADELEDVPDAEKRGPRTRMNDNYVAVNDAGRFRVMFQQQDPITKRDKWIKMKKGDFMDLLANVHMSKKKPAKKKDGEVIEWEVVKVPIAPEWISWPQRRTVKEVIFDPERQHADDILNLWTGWGVDPEPGDWSLMQELIEDVLCDGYDEANEYVLNWIAHMVQKPWLPAEVAICFRGDKGTGKSTLGDALVAMAGKHGIATSSSEYLTGRFNGHLMQNIMLFADEAVAPTDKGSESTLKALITQKNFNFEEKFETVRMGRNHNHIMMASNQDWFVSAGATDGERRYFVSEVSNKRKGDKKFFDRLYKQMYVDGGLAAMLHDMQTRDIAGWSPRDGVPEMEALTEQKILNMSKVGKWWFNMLEAGEHDMAGDLDKYDGVEKLDWEAGSIVVPLDYVKRSFRTFCHDNSIKPGTMGLDIDKEFWRELRKFCPTINTNSRMALPEDFYDPDLKVAPSDGRIRAATITNLAECRRVMAEALGGFVRWDD